MLASSPLPAPPRWARTARAARYFPLLLTVIPALWLGLAIFGVVRAYSPVPYWDMWDDYVRAYGFLRSSGDRQAYVFGQANEHRLVFSKVTFAIDIALFGGRAKFLFAVNVALMTALWLTLAAMAKRLLRDHGDLWLIVACGLAAPALSWLHEGNLTWAFQGQFFVAYLMPLLAFACLARSLENDKLTGWFAAAVVFGLCAMGTMANGLFAVPLMALMIAFGRRPMRSRLLILLTVYAVAAAFWFRNYTFIPRDTPPLAEVTVFLLTFFGAPIKSLTNDLLIGEIAGAALIAAIAMFALYWLRTRERQATMVLALVAFGGYLGASGATISWGRAGLIPDATHAPRYLTPALLAWCTLALMLAYAFRNLRHARAWYVGASIAIAFLWFAPERSTAKPDDIQKRNIAGLAVLMDIFDAPAIATVYPIGTPEMNARLKSARQIMRDLPMSMFGDPAWRRAVDAVGASSAHGFHRCLGVVDATAPIANEERYRRVSGWAVELAARHVPQFAHIASEGRIVGVAITGAPRRDVGEIYGWFARSGGFDGYVTAPEGAQLEVVCAD